MVMIISESLSIVLQLYWDRKTGQTEIRSICFIAAFPVGWRQCFWHIVFPTYLILLLYSIAILTVVWNISCIDCLVQELFF